MAPATSSIGNSGDRRGAGIGDRCDRSGDERATLQRRRANVLGPARSLDADLLAVFDTEPELGGDDDLAAAILERATQRRLRW